MTGCIFGLQVYGPITREGEGWVLEVAVYGNQENDD